MNKCKLKCLNDDRVIQSNHFKSSYNNRNYVIKTNEILNCKSLNIIYLITCKICKLQYVGETQRSFEIRIREHLDKIRKGDKSQYVYAHFQDDEEHCHTPLEDLIQFQIIEKIYSDDSNDITNHEMRQRRIQRELYWISKLGTTYPLGLNDRIAAFGISGFAVKGEIDDYNPHRINNLYPKRPKKKNRGKRKCKKCYK